MEQELFFAGDEMTLLAKLHETGCVMTDDTHFYCPMEGESLPYNCRIPVRIQGQCIRQEEGWKITYRMAPAPKTKFIGILFPATAVCCLVVGNNSTAGIFAIMTVALGMYYWGQKESCLKQFAGFFRQH